MPEHLVKRDCPAAEDHAEAGRLRLFGADRLDERFAELVAPIFIAVEIDANLIGVAVEIGFDHDSVDSKVVDRVAKFDFGPSENHGDGLSRQLSIDNSVVERGVGDGRGEGVAACAEQCRERPQPESPAAGAENGAEKRVVRRELFLQDRTLSSIVNRATI